MRVRVIEDDDGLAAGLRTGLRTRGGVVDIAPTVDAAQAALHAERVDILLLDFGLPDRDGLTWLARLRAGRADTRPAHAGADHDGARSGRLACGRSRPGG